MRETHAFLSPDYFSSFSCKMGACRTACCQGWPISLSMENYFHLLGMECSPELRRKLDCGMHMADPPSPEQYAQFTPRYDGDCPLRLEDGRCALHADMGEDILPDICRLYPRGIRVKNERFGGRFECSCANSCEGVLELFWGRQKPITFSEQTYTFIMPPHPGCMEDWETYGLDWEIRYRLIRILQNRALSVPARLLTLGREMEKLGGALGGGNDQAVKMWLTEEPIWADCTAQADAEQDKTLLLLCQLTELLGSRHRSIEDYAAAVTGYFGNGEKMIETFLVARTRFTEVYPDWPLFAEHALVNHMFFAQFPFRNPPEPECLMREYEALCVLYGLLSFMAVGWTAAHPGTEDLIDVCAALFRTVDHTSFERYIIPMLRRFGNCWVQQTEQTVKIWCYK